MLFEQCDLSVTSHLNKLLSFRLNRAAKVLPLPLVINYRMKAFVCKAKEFYSVVLCENKIR